MRDEIQRIINHLAKSLEAPVVLQDTDHSLIAHSFTDRDAVDWVRERSILHHRVEDADLAWFRQIDLANVEEPVRLPGNKDLRILPRLYVPVRSENAWLGQIWIIDIEDTASSASQIIVDAASGIAELLRELALRHQLGATSVAALVSDDPELRREGLSQLRGLHLINASAPVEVAVIDLDMELDWEERGSLDRALRHNGLFSRGQAAATANGATALLPSEDESHRRNELDSLVTNISDRLGIDKSRVHGGIGPARDNLEELHQSYERAKFALKAAKTFDHLPSFVHFDDLGLLAMLVSSHPEHLPLRIDPRAALLFETGDSELIDSVSAYLDMGCDVKATSEYLFVHRGTLYYRLEKLARLTGLDLHNGLDRTALHMSLLVHRLQNSSATQPISK